VRSQEDENVIFLELLETYGAYKLEEKIQRREITRKYYRRWPYDGYSKRVGMDTVDLTMPTEPLSELLSSEARDELLQNLTPRELEVALWAEAGFKPKDMASMRGSVTSNADRWMKHQVKQKMGEALADD
jgi:hypothetical protein